MRSVVGGWVAVAAAAGVTAVTVTASEAAVSAPYDAVVVQTSESAYNYPIPSHEAYDAGNATVVGSAVGEAVTLTATPSNGASAYVFTMAPTDGSWVVGNTYVAWSNATMTAGHGAKQITINYGSLHILEIVRDPASSAVTAFAAEFSILDSGTIDQPSRQYRGHLRWNSTVGYVAATVEGSLDFGEVLLEVPVPPRILTVRGAGSQPLVIDQVTTIGQFHVTEDTCTGAELAYGETCRLTVVAYPATRTSQSSGQERTLLLLDDNSVTGETMITTKVTFYYDNPGGQYEPLTPRRILDTRSGLGARKGTVGTQTEIQLQVTGAGGVPTKHVGAVVLNVTVVGSTKPSFVTVYPAGVARPITSSVNFPAGWTGANMVTVKVGTGGRVSLYNNSGSVHLVADVVGFYYPLSVIKETTWGMGSDYHPIVPTRLLDTRIGDDGPLPGGWSIEVPFSFGYEIDQHMAAVVLNVTVVNPTGPGHLTTWDGTSDLPPTSTLNFTSGQIVPNMAVTLSSWCEFCGTTPAPMKIGFYTTRTTHLVVDLVGFYNNQVEGGLRFEPLTPTRIVDSRKGQGLPAAVGPLSTATVSLPSAMSTPGVTALVTNATAIQPTGNTHLTFWSADPDVPRPTASNLNAFRGQIVSNAVYAELGPTGAFNVYNNTGNTHLAVDVVGRFIGMLPRPVPATAKTSIVPAQVAALRLRGDVPRPIRHARS